MAETAFFDTNVLLYIHDRSSPKGTVARALFARYARARKAVVSTLVLQEFYVNLERVAPHASPQDAVRLVASYARLPLVTVGLAHILAAISLRALYRLAFCDGLILAAAKSADAAVVFSEDFSHGQVYAGVRVENPFRAPAH